jgi:hypothetical protein
MRRNTDLLVERPAPRPPLARLRRARLPHTDAIRGFVYEAGGTLREYLPRSEMRYDVNLSILFTELPLLERPAAARPAGPSADSFGWLPTKENV